MKKIIIGLLAILMLTACASTYNPQPYRLTGHIDKGGEKADKSIIEGWHIWEDPKDPITKTFSAVAILKGKDNKGKAQKFWEFRATPYIDEIVLNCDKALREIVTLRLIYSGYENNYQTFALRGRFVWKFDGEEYISVNMGTPSLLTDTIGSVATSSTRKAFLLAEGNEEITDMFVRKSQLIIRGFERNNPVITYDLAGTNEVVAKMQDHCQI